jgi:2-polyprenyl-3-methyl-5-hydroxy-6-metoxy-1,4-benzoquinol methylase
MGSPEKLYHPVKFFSGRERINLAEFILLRAGGGGNFCLGCGRKTLEVVYRDLNRSFTMCRGCGLVNQLYFGDTQVQYSNNYFFEDYKRQYGRTYLEDFDNIKEIGKRRCREIRIKPGASLLDIGCGYGPFLAAAAESGLEPYGIDVCEEAISFVNNELGIPAAAVPVEDFGADEFGLEGIDVVTMWYVIEHLQDLPEVLSKVNALLPKGGVFAFATPNYNGITRLRFPDRFFRESPLDHYTIWSSRAVRKVMNRYGFKIKKITSPSAHPVRFFRNSEKYERINRFLKGAVDRMLIFISRKFLLGDTFEIYAEKADEIIEDGSGD